MSETKYKSKVRIEYVSPIELTYQPMETIMDSVRQAVEQLDDKVGRTVVSACIKVGVNVNKEELIRALQYDRDQFQIGYAAGYNEGREATLADYRAIGLSWRIAKDDPPPCGQPVIVYQFDGHRIMKRIDDGEYWIDISSDYFERIDPGAVWMPCPAFDGSILEDADADEKIYPLTVIPDRYGGAYSEGGYLAFNLDPNEVPEDVYGDDTACMMFWCRNSLPVGKGQTPYEAIKNLYKKLQKEE